MSNPINLGGKASDNPMSSGGGGFEPGPASSAFAFIPGGGGNKPQAVIVGFFPTSPDQWWTFTELWDPSAPKFLQTRPVPQDHVADHPEARTSQRCLAPFVLLHRKDSPAAAPGQDIAKLVALKVPKTLYNSLKTRHEMTAGMPFDSFLVMLNKTGTGMSTEYHDTWMGPNPDAGNPARFMAGMTLADGTPLTLANLSDWLGEQVMAEYRNMDPSNPVNVAAAAERAGRAPGGAQPQQAQAPHFQPPTVDAGWDDEGHEYTYEELAAMSPAQLRDLCDSLGVARPAKAAEFKAAMPNIIQAILTQKVAA